MSSNRESNLNSSNSNNYSYNRLGNSSPARYGVYCPKFNGHNVTAFLSYHRLEGLLNPEIERSLYILSKDSFTFISEEYVKELVILLEKGLFT